MRKGTHINIMFPKRPQTVFKNNSTCGEDEQFLLHSVSVIIERLVNKLLFGEKAEINC